MYNPVVSWLNPYRLLGLILISLLLSVGLASADALQLNSERQRELEYLLKQDCGSCHGLRLKGGLGPSLLPEALAGKPDNYLKQVISMGMPGTAMPPWQNLLSEQEIDYLVYLITSQATTQSGIVVEVKE